jgi:site-specific DNA-methyltransferase (adenine-specific)
MKLSEKITITNEDNMALMARYPDGYFDLAIVDPPYGIGATKKMGINKKKGYNPEKWIGGEWDNETPKKEYFEELFRVSRNQIIWGGNYFDLPPTRCFYIWDKKQRIDQADCELAWTSFNKSARIFDFWNSRLIGFMNPNRFHPTEKPIDLYKWLLENNTKQGDKILDTHLGSGSIAIACHDYDFELTACELDKEYYNNAIKRIKNHMAQQKLF